MYLKKLNTGLNIKDVDLKTRTVTGHFASFDTVDSDGEVFLPGAFAKSIKENGPKSNKPRIAHLYMHSSFQPVGALKELLESNSHLYFESNVPNTTLGTDVLKMYEAGVVKEHSVGFSPIRDKSYFENDVRYFQEVKLWEGSTVTWGANEDTAFQGFKSLTKEQAVERMDALIKAIKDGTFTDETFHLLEIGLEQIKSHIESLDKKEPKKFTLPPLEPIADIYSSFTKSFQK